MLTVEVSRFKTQEYHWVGFTTMKNPPCMVLIYIEFWFSWPREICHKAVTRDPFFLSQAYGKQFHPRSSLVSPSTSFRKFRVWTPPWGDVLHLPIVPPGA